MSSTVISSGQPERSVSSLIVPVLLVVTLGVGCVALLVLPLLILGGVRTYHEAQLRRARSDLSALNNLLDAYALDHAGRYPSSLEELEVPELSDGSTGPPLDPWGNRYQYDPASPRGHHARLFSFGCDGRPGGAGSAADVDLDETESRLAEETR